MRKLRRRIGGCCGFLLVRGKGAVQGGLDERETGADPVAVAGVDEFVGAAGETAFGGVLAHREPGDEVVQVEVLAQRDVRRAEEAQAGDCERDVCAMGFVAGASADPAFERLRGGDPFAETVGEAFQAGEAGRGVQREGEGQVEEMEHYHRAVRAAGVALAVLAHLEAPVGLFQPAEPVPEGLAVDQGVDFAAAGECDAHDSGVGAGKVGVLAVATAETPLRMLDWCEGFDDTGERGGDVGTGYRKTVGETKQTWELLKD